uniref:Uncharacterized protein n=1 Tax=Anopheles atroparvus TaxID=41427 RepID=A0AAG5DX19_ANOAO
MDLLKKFMGLDGRKDDDDDNRKKKATLKDEFRKPIWVEEDDSDDELFDNQKIYGVQIFTNPLEMQKHFEHQLQEMWKSLEEYDENAKLFDHDLKQDFLKPGFEEAVRDIGKQMKPQDTDLDGEIYPDQLHTLLQRISPELKELIPKKRNDAPVATPNSTSQRRKLTDEEKVMDLIHGIKEQQQHQPAGSLAKPKRGGLQQRFHEGGIFEGAFQGPRMFGQSIISQTIRRPDGSYETRRTVRDSEGNTQTTVTLATKDGRKETVTTYDDGRGGGEGGMPPARPYFGLKKDELVEEGPTGALLALGNKFVLNNNGYVLPKNLW